MGKNILTKELLLKSVVEWNAARRANPDLKPDLHQADLRGANLRDANLVEADLSNASLSDTNLSEANLSSAYLVRANLLRVGLKKARLRSANLYKACLSSARLTGANLTKVDLSEADLRAADLTEVNLNGADLTGADLSRVHLNRSYLIGARLYGTHLIGADISLANLSRSHFIGVHLNGAYLVGADLSFANLNRTYFSGADLSVAILSGTTFGAVDLSNAIGLEKIQHKGPSTIGIDTLLESHGNIPEVFLRGCGVPDLFIEYVHSLTAKAFDYYSCFISYSAKDDDFAKRIHNDLQASGVRCWFAPHDIQGGKKLLPQIEEAILLYDKLLLILSPDSMNSNWVETEIINAIQKEQQQRKQVLFPISIAPFEEIKQWKLFDADTGRDLAREIREYHIPDFSRWGSDQAAYKTAFDRLLKDLKQ